MANTFEESIAEGLALHRSGRWSEAETIYQRLLGDFPNHPTPLNLYGALAISTGRFDLAETLLRRAIAANPSEANYHSNLGEALRRQAKLSDAIAAYREALGLNPRLATTHSNLGIALAASDQLDAAIESFGKAIGLQPSDASAWSNLGNALGRLGRMSEAVRACKQAVALRPADADLQKNLGVALAADNQFNVAIDAYETSLSLRPDDVETLSNLCNALSALGHDAAAIDAGKRATLIDPESVQAHWNFAVALLRAGEWRRGWIEYEWRWKRTPMPFSQPQWSGAAQANQTVLLHAEQGFGDSIQFARFVPIAADLIHSQGGEVIVQAQPPLVELFKTLEGVDEVVSTNDSVPIFDVHLPFMSLGRVLNVRPDNVPGRVPYLSASPIGSQQGTGVCFTGNPTHTNDRARSIASAETKPLMDHLQIAVWLDPANNPELVDFNATAKVIASLQRVICVDTAVAHLAGALGTPVWILLPAVADWRWLRDTATTPWYPTARLFRQRIGETWAAVIGRVIDALKNSA